MRFWKYHALGNDYIVLDPADAGETLGDEFIRRLCHRNFGVGSDGILLGPLPAGAVLKRAKDALCGLRIFNPDASEAEKSGNGLRIFCRYLYDTGRVKDEIFRLETLGGMVGCQVLDGGARVRVEMGKVSFNSADIPVAGPAREVINETIEVGGREVVFCAATVGNPHCVVPRERATAEEAHDLGPLLERHPWFPKRTNVQFMQVLDRHNIRIEIWERGAGYTLASGSSGSACAAVARRLGLCDGDITVHMPGGVLGITVADDYSITMLGPVTGVAQGVVDREMI